MAKEDNPKKPKKRKGLKMALLALLVSLFGGGAIWWFTGGKNRVKGKKKEDKSEELIEFEEIPEEKPIPSHNPPALPRIPVGGKGRRPGDNDRFPLGPGMKGPYVQAVQEFLIRNYGRKVLPRWGADRQWGKETTAALQALKVKIPISLAFFKAVVEGEAQGKLSLPPDPLSGGLGAPDPTRNWNNY